MSSDFLLRPSHRSYNAILAAVVTNNHLSLAKTLFNEMKLSGVPFTVSSFNILIKALCSSGVIEAAFRIFHRMPGRRCPPDACTYSTLIDGLCQHGRVDDACLASSNMLSRCLMR
ncbi:pentatricopeptide repeat-containing protein At5g46100-like [Dendrobium catenatum]|uniref:pentatricopeptide repeat-containing protein At5g46100-like n=1 Tax=Dendrobium catenatum TaxID=906689 RepID=UPI00109FA855|nr:pentatricopeptide repeat-containing protein At5g46100-like [Dendrobium catenatum]